MKIYNKRGVPNFKEKNLINKLKAFFEANPHREKEYTPATDFDELKKAHDYFLTEEAIVVESNMKEPPIASEPTKEAYDLFSGIIDPINRDEPKIRDYVLNSELKDDVKQTETRSTYAEPTSFRDSFEIPGSDPIREEKKEPLNSRPQQPRDKTPDPDAKIKRKSKKKFTKYAVDAVCALAGRGIVWFATKDITDEKLQEMVQGDEIGEASLKMLVFLDHNTQGTVKQFFELHITKAQDLAYFSEEEKDDLAEALEDWMEYKKIEINPTIQLGTILIGMVFNRAMAALQMRAETGSILNQLKSMHAGEMQRVHNIPQPQPQPVPQQEPTNTEEESEHNLENENIETHG